MTEKKEETALSTNTETGFELSVTSAQSATQYEIQGAIIVAKKFPRNEDEAFERLMKSCRRTSFAESVAYSFPRGGKLITGPSVHIAREFARVWKNIRYGLEILLDTDEQRQIRGWAWDVESNTKVSQDDYFKKLIYRKDGGWIVPDERDLRELTNRRGAILMRNCILQLLPSDFIDDALALAKETIKKAADQDPDSFKKKMIVVFSGINITVEMLEKKLGHKLDQCNSEELTELRQIFESIRDGNSKWKDYENRSEKGTSEKATGKIKVEDLKTGKTDNRGHEQTGLDDLILEETLKSAIVQLGNAMNRKQLDEQWGKNENLQNNKEYKWTYQTTLANIEAEERNKKGNKQKDRLL